jgi:TolB-like protein
MQPASGVLRAGALRAALSLAAAWLCAGSAWAEPSVRIAVLPVVVHSLDDHGYLRDGLSDMLAARLARNGSVAVVRVEDAARATTQPEAARAAAQELGADYALFGSFTRFGDGASLDLQCLKVSGKSEDDVRSIFIHSGTLAQIIPRVDQLADKVLRYVGGEAPVAEAADRAGEPGGGTLPSSVATDLQDALVQLDAVMERLDRLEDAVYSAGEEKEEVTETSPEDVGDASPIPELSSARGEAPPLP